MAESTANHSFQWCTVVARYLFRVDGGDNFLVKAMSRSCSRLPTQSSQNFTSIWNRARCMRRQRRLIKEIDLSRTRMRWRQSVYDLLLHHHRRDNTCIDFRQFGCKDAADEPLYIAEVSKTSTCISVHDFVLSCGKDIHTIASSSETKGLTIRIAFISNQAPETNVVLRHLHKGYKALNTVSTCVPTPAMIPSCTMLCAPCSLLRSTPTGMD